MNNNINGCEVILGNSNSRFSGVTSTMLQTFSHQQKKMCIYVLGNHHLPDKSRAISFLSALKMCRMPPLIGEYRVFHARRNDEMLQALILRKLSKGRLKILFTSTAQRHHSMFTKKLMAKMDNVISTCNAAASYLNPGPTAIVPHGIDTQTYHPCKHNEKTGVKRIAMFGRVRPQKGTHLLVESCLRVFTKHKNCEAIIVGAIKEAEQDYVNELKHKIASANLSKRIRFLGEQHFDTIPSLFRSADIVTALSDNEGFGLTVLEAMSSGAVVIATEAGAWPDIIQHGNNGFLIPTNDIEAISHYLDKLLTSPETVKQVSNNARNHVLEHYTIEKEADRLCSIYSSMQFSHCYDSSKT